MEMPTGILRSATIALYNEQWLVYFEPYEDADWFHIAQTVYLDEAQIWVRDWLLHATLPPIGTTTYRRTSGEGTTEPAAHEEGPEQRVGDRRSRKLGTKQGVPQESATAKTKGNRGRRGVR